MDDRLGLSIEHPDGRTTRWGPDEPNAQDIPGDTTFGTQIPGLFKDLSCPLLRRIDVDYPDLGLYDGVRVYGPGNRTAWEGRMAQFPRSHGDSFEIVPGAVGWSAALNDKPTFTEPYVDRDPGSFSEWPLDRRLALAAANISMGDLSWSQDAGGLNVALPNQALGTQTMTEAWALYPPGRKVTKIMYQAASTSLPAGWVVDVVSSDDPSVATTLQTLTADNTLRTQALTTARRFIGLVVWSAGTAATPAAGALVRFSKIAAYGNHGLTTRANGTEPDGVYASDVVRDIVTRTAPGLTIGTIDADAFVIPHLVFDTPTTGEDAIQYVNAYHGKDWGVEDNRTFFWRTSDPNRLTWQARLSTGARLDLEGETAEQIYNGVYVMYTDHTGTRKTVAPSGTDADNTDATLADTSSTNPLNAWGYTRWGLLEISQTTTLAGAVQLGRVWLAEHSVPQRRGTLTLTGAVTHPTEGDVPVWRVRAGDYVAISDHPADVPRRIIETRYNHATRTVTANLDNTPHALDAIMGRLGVSLVGVL